jgi:HEAT repeat protein
MDEHLKTLLDNLTGSDGMARQRARETLVLAGEQALAELRALLSSPDKQTRWEATKALATMSDAGSLDAFLALLDDQNSDIRWLAADGLIHLGPRSVRPVLQGLTGPKLTRGRLEMSHRVLGELSSDHKLLADIIAPLMQAIGGNDPAVTAERAARALSDYDEAVGRTPRLAES